MKLSENTINKIISATNLACLLQIDGIILDDQGIRGYNDDEGVIIAAIDDFDFEFESLGLLRLQSLKNKISVLRDSEFTIEALPKKRNDKIIEKLHFESGKIDFDFRCALPKSITDVPRKKFNKNAEFSFEITDEDVNTIIQGISSMRCQNMTIQGTPKLVRFRFSDETGDVFNYKLDSDLKLGGDSDTMSLTINVKKMLPILKIAAQPGKFRLNILANNIVYLSVNDLDIFVMAEV
jgi:hypothetical protein